MQTFAVASDISEIREFVAVSVRRYPVTAAELVVKAESYQNGEEVAEFFRAFSPEVKFDNRDDLLSRSEQVKILENAGASKKRLPNYEEFDSY